MAAVLAWPLTWLTVTVGIYLVFARAQNRLQKQRWAQVALNPIAWSVAAVVALLESTGVSYDVYFEGGKLLHLLLGPATVALAIPLYEQRQRIRAAAAPLLLSLAAGSVTATVSAVAFARMCGAPVVLQRSFVPKSVTTPIAIAISENIGGNPSITTAVVLVTGIVGGVLLLPWLDISRIRNVEARGFALGLCAHGVGTARAFQVSNEMGAFAGVAVGLNGIFTALIVPVLLPWLVAP
jgi:predicted murein hydrolase (TIGR00659 family)